MHRHHLDLEFLAGLRRRPLVALLALVSACSFGTVPATARVVIAQSDGTTARGTTVTAIAAPSTVTLASSLPPITPPAPSPPDTPLPAAPNQQVAAAAVAPPASDVDGVVRPNWVTAGDLLRRVEPDYEVVDQCRAAVASKDMDAPDVDCLAVPKGQVVPYATYVATDGAWALVRVRASVADDERVSWQVARVWTGKPIQLGAKRVGRGEVSLAGVFDFDADGDSEVVAIRTEALDASAGSYANEVVIFTSKGGRVNEYAPARQVRVVDLLDVDDDGRPDLLIDPYRITVETSDGPQRGHRTWTHAGHLTRTGSIAFGDQGAREWARRLCPARPRLDDVLSAGATAAVEQIHCALVWGLGATAIDSALASACGPAADDSRRKTCADVRLAWAEMRRLRQPITLSP